MSQVLQKPKRILSIDIMRGLTLFLMLFVNDLYESGVPEWLLHAKANFDGMGLADWVFPGFLFMVGVSIPYAIQSRREKGQRKAQIFGHIVVRTLSLLLIGVLMLNSEQLNSELSGINQSLWTILMYVSVFLIWNKYPDIERLNKIFLGLKTLGILGLLALAFLFKAGEPGNVSWFEIGWWGILGLIGWGYLVAATVGLFIGERLVITILLWFFFVVLNILSSLGILNFLDFINPIFGVIIDGNVPSIVLAGLLVGLIFKQRSFSPLKKTGIVLLLGLFSLAVGFFLRKWFIISKLQGTPSWAMICNGISMFIFVLLYFVVDIKGRVKWAKVFMVAGQNSLTTYLAPYVIYYLIWGMGWSLFFYKQSTCQLLAVGGSIVWALAMVGFSALLSKIEIRLKL